MPSPLESSQILLIFSFPESVLKWVSKVVALSKGPLNLGQSKVFASGFKSFAFKW